MDHRFLRAALLVFATSALAGCGARDETRITSTDETVGTISECCSLADGEWSMTPVGQTANQATLSFRGEECGLMELRDGSYDAVSDRDGYVATTLAGHDAAVKRPDRDGEALMALVGNVNEHPEHLSIQIRCETVDCPEFRSLTTALVLQVD